MQRIERDNSIYRSVYCFRYRHELCLDIGCKCECHIKKRHVGNPNFQRLKGMQRQKDKEKLLLLRAIWIVVKHDSRLNM